MKKDIVPIIPMLERVRALNPMSFRYKPVAGTEPSTIGFIAQEVEDETADLRSEVAGLRQENAALKARLERLEQRLLKAK